MIIFFPIGSSGSAAAGEFTASDYVTEALQALGVVGAIDPPTPEDANVGLGLLNRICDNLNVDRKAAYAYEALAFTLTPNLSPHTIGPSSETPTWVVSVNRPQSIL